MHRFLIATSLAAIAPICLLAQAPAAAPPAPEPDVVTMTLAGTIKAEYISAKDLWRRTADAMPAEAYAFKPTPEMRTFAAGMGHLLASNIGQCNALLGRKHPLSGVNLEQTLTTKADTVKAVADTFAYCDEYFLTIDASTSLTDTFVTMTGRRNGQPTTFKVSNGASVVHFLDHNNEMYGYLSVYLRLKGIVPPSSAPKG